ncbi:MAG: hypothetical protein FWD11_07895, partial [Micrococcales bacterium]|nr:hypothetical protein [Micrococcales bacterium]
IDAQDEPMADAVSTATGLLTCSSSDSAAAACRSELVTTLAEHARKKGKRVGWGGRRCRAAPVLAAVGLLDLGEVVPQAAAKRAVTMVTALSASYDRQSAHALGSACRVLGAVVPGQELSVRAKTLGRLQTLVDSPDRVAQGPDGLGFDELFTSQLRALLETLTKRPSDWSGLFASLDHLDVPDDCFSPPSDPPPVSV